MGPAWGTKGRGGAKPNLGRSAHRAAGRPSRRKADAGLSRAVGRHRLLRPPLCVIHAPPPFLSCCCTNSRASSSERVQAAEQHPTSWSSVSGLSTAWRCSASVLHQCKQRGWAGGTCARTGHCESTHGAAPARGGSVAEGCGGLRARSVSVVRAPRAGNPSQSLLRQPPANPPQRFASRLKSQVATAACHHVRP